MNLVLTGFKSVKKIDFEYVPPDSKTSEELVAKRLGLSNSAKASVVDLLSIKLDAVFWELESLLNH